MRPRARRLDLRPLHRITVILASVLVGLSSHFPLVSVRWGLVGLGACLVVFAAIEILQLPAPAL